MSQRSSFSAIAKKHGLKLIADQAQGFGCTLNGRQPLEWADVATASFFPAKPLGCYGDGGAILTNDDSLAGLIDSIRIHGKASAEDMAAKKYDNDPRYLNMRIGVNSRLDALQAAILSEKLKIYPDELKKRDAIAQRIHRRYLSPAALADPQVGPIFAAFDDVAIRLTPSQWLWWSMGDADAAYFGGKISANPGYLLPLG